MAIRESEISLVLPELEDALVGRLLSQVWQPSRQEVLLGFASGDILLLCPRGPDARLHTVDRRPKNPKRPFSFQGACRAHLQGPLTRIDKTPGDRVLDLWFGEHRLHLRLTGNIGGLWLLKGDKVIAAYDGPAPDALPELEPGGIRDLPPRIDEPLEGSWDRALRAFFEERIAERRRRELRIEVGRGLRREVQRLSRLHDNLDHDLQRADRADEVRAMADTLAANLHHVEGGPDHVALPSFDDPDQLLTIPLIQGKAPSASLDRLYRKARRLERMGEAVLERMETTQQRLDEARDLRQRLEELTLPELDRLARRFRQSGRRDQPQGIPGVTVWVGPDGERVLVGRDAKANRRLTFQMGKGHDWWMHQRERPGSHVLIKMKRGKTPSLELLLAAAQIAAVHAGVPEGGRIEVQYARIRDIRSIPGSVAMVRVHNEKVLEIVRDPAEITGWTRA